MAIGRQAVNAVRYVLEELLPPALRDSVLFLPLMYLAYGRHTRRFIAFRARARTMNDAEFAWYYAVQPGLMADTDLSRACIEAIERDVVGGTLADIGCGRLYLVARIARSRPGMRCVGLDMAMPELPALPPNLMLCRGRLGQLPFADRAFDTVICTHTLEHVPDLAGAIADLRRITRRRLIVVVPREREYRYAFNLHVHFFPYLDSFLNRIDAPLGRHEGRLLGRDIYYREDMAAEA